MSNPASYRGLRAAAVLSSIIVVSALVFSVFQETLAQIYTECDLYFTGDIVINSIPLADNSTQIRRGLSGEGGAGKMLFSWETEVIRTFWMKNTKSNLSIGFFDKEGFLFQVADMQAGTEEKHFSNRPALFALELAKGQFKLTGLELGSRLIKKECRAF
jgi:uncharacterized protein